MCVAVVVVNIVVNIIIAVTVAVAGINIAISLFEMTIFQASSSSSFKFHLNIFIALIK